MKKCLLQSCQKEFEPNKPKQVFCSAVCRVYYSRELKRKELPHPIIKITDLTKPTNTVKPFEQPKTNFSVFDDKKEDIPIPQFKSRTEQMKWMKDNKK